MKRNLLSGAALLVVLLFNSCSKSDRNQDREIVSVTDNLFALNAVNDVYKQVMEAASQQVEFNKVQASPTITVTPAAPDTTFPKTMVIDYSSSNIADINGVNHRGQLSAVFSNKYKVYNASIAVSFMDYYYKDMKVSGTYTISNKGNNPAGNMVFYITVKDMTIYTADGKKYIFYNCLYKKEWLLGNGTQDTQDDTYAITGGGDGINQLGNSFTAVIETALSSINTCQHIVSGVIKVTPQNLTVRRLNFGDGNCDGDMTFNVNGSRFYLTEN